jgi:thiol:disulfide interchange protein DsbD
MSRTARLGTLLSVLLVLVGASPAAIAQVPGFGGFPGSAPHGEPKDTGSGLSTDKVKVRAVASTMSPAAGADLVVAVELAIAPGWHAWPNQRALPKGTAEFIGAVHTTVAVTSGDPSKVTVHEGFTQWPDVHTVKADLGDGEQSYAVFEGRSIVFVPVTIAPGASGAVTLTVKAGFQTCDNATCLAPADVTETISLAIGGTSTTPPAGDLFTGFDPAVFGRIRGGEQAPVSLEFKLTDSIRFEIDPRGSGLVLLALLAALGGVLLNFTPCVLPVIPLKIMSLSRAAGTKGRMLKLGVIMSLGVVFFWVALGTLFALASTGIKSLEGFGQLNALFQLPWFTIAVGVFICVMAIGMAGFFTVGLPNWVYSIETKQESAGGSFVFGIMTAVLSTPCTAPLMGAAAGYAIKIQDPATVMLVFTSIGVGMALPYLLLSLNPRLVDRMPRGGAAGELLKQCMGLLLLAAGIYFVGSGVNGYLEEPSHAYWWLVSLAGIAAGLWLVRGTLKIAKTGRNRTVFGGVGLFIAGLSALIGWSMTYEAIAWQTWTAEREALAIKDGKVVLVDFTADWCINCKTLEKTVLESSAVLTALEEHEVVPLKVDLTSGVPARGDRLKAAGGATIPLLVIVSPKDGPIWKSELYTPGDVVAAIDRAGK